MNRVIVAGSRNFTNYLLLRKTLASLPYEIDEIISGTARGADRLGEVYAESHGIPVKRMPADWDRYGKSAGYKRNAEMAKEATHCVVFWDGKSRGTKSMIDLAKKHGLNTKVVQFKPKKAV